MLIKKLREGFTLGADPEFFLSKFVSAKKPRTFCSAAGLLPGTKDEPFIVERGAIQVDGFAAEININPAKTFEEFDGNMTAVMEQLGKHLPDDVRITEQITVDIPEKMFAEASPKTTVIGCDPDWNAWTAALNPPPDTDSYPRRRWVGGHLHVGWTKDADKDDLLHRAACFDFVKQLDWYLGAWSAIADLDKKRKLAYGQAGACRIKPYGVEYRTLSSFWCHTTDNRLEVWNRTCAAIDDMRERHQPTLRHSHNSYITQGIKEGGFASGILTKYEYPIVEVM